MPSPITLYVDLRNGRTRQINLVTAVAIIAPTMLNGTYRDTPPVIGGSASGAISSAAGNLGPATIAGGVNPTVALASGPPVTISIIGASSVLQDDRYLHTAPRFWYHPESIVVFTTSNGMNLTYPSGTAAAPTTTTGTFDVVYKWKDIIGWSNVAPQGWAA